MTHRAEQLHWQTRAACRDIDPELFFPHPSDQFRAAEAKKVCWRCPVKQRCLLDALTEPVQWGIRGGKSANAREQIKRRSG